MSLWARLKAWWEAGKAGRQMMNARRQHDRAEAILAGAATLGAHGAYISGHHGTGGYHGPSGADCGPGVSGDCGGTAV
jgi:hypothetical protein